MRLRGNLGKRNGRVVGAGYGKRGFGAYFTLIFYLGICLATDITENQYEKIDSPLQIVL